MIGYMSRVVRMAIAEFGDHRFKCIEHVEVGAGIEVGGGQSGSGMENQEIANAKLVCMFFAEPVFQSVGDIDHFALLPRLNLQFMHGLGMLDKISRMYGKSGT